MVDEDAESKTWFRITSFDAAFDPRDNAFGFLRLCLSACVLVSHSFALGGFGAEPLVEASKGQVTLGLLSVMSFFSLSGFLITRSMATSPSVGRFLWNRFLRIFPGYLVCHVVVTLLFVPLFAALDAHGLPAFLRDHGPAYLAFFEKNLFLNIGVFTLPLLVDNPYPQAINGSLWSLIYEWDCYLIVAILGFLSWSRAYRWLSLALALYLYWGGIRYAEGKAVFQILPSSLWSLWLLRLGPYFFLSGAAFHFRKSVPNHALLFAVAVLLIHHGLRTESLAWFGPPSVAYAVLWLALNLPKRLSWFDRAGDISYGLYIYAFPLQQTLAALGLQRFGLVAFIVSSFAGTLILAVASFRFVEKPFLKLKGLALGQARTSPPAVAER